MQPAAGSAAGNAYQGAFEAVMAVLVGAGLGYWADVHWETTPVGVISGVVVGFAAMVLRLLRLGRELVPESTADADGTSTGERSGGSKGIAGSKNASASASGSPAEAGDDVDGLGDADRGPAEMPALSDIWSDDAAEERD
ncbi:MAG: AtpZ/AtpI family protein [Myxococcota bacterium]